MSSLPKKKAAISLSFCEIAIMLIDKAYPAFLGKAYPSFLDKACPAFLGKAYPAFLGKAYPAFLDKAYPGLFSGSEGPAEVRLRV
jgi:hypothetical protein